MKTYYGVLVTGILADILVAQAGATVLTKTIYSYVQGAIRPRFPSNDVVRSTGPVDGLHQWLSLPVGG